MDGEREKEKVGETEVIYMISYRVNISKVDGPRTDRNPYKAGTKLYAGQGQKTCEAGIYFIQNLRHQAINLILLACKSLEERLSETRGMSCYLLKRENNLRDFVLPPRLDDDDTFEVCIY